MDIIRLNNTTLFGYDSQDLELINMVQSGVSLICTMIILVKVMDVPSFFKNVRDKRIKLKKNKEKREMEKMRKLMEALQKGGDVLIDELLSNDDDDDDDVRDAGAMRIARKKAKHILLSYHFSYSLKKGFINLYTTGL
jgi:hypothetical protein